MYLAPCLRWTLHPSATIAAGVIKASKYSQSDPRGRYSRRISMESRLISFDFVDDESPLKIALDEQHYCERIYSTAISIITFTRPIYTAPHTFPIYVRSQNLLSRRSHIDIIGLIRKRTVSSSHPTVPHRDQQHWRQDYTDTVMPRGTKWSTYWQGRYDQSRLRGLWKEIADSCSICARSGRRLASKHISMTYICKNLYEETQTDFMFADIRM